MTVKEYVEKMVKNAAETREINVGEEVWNILYNLLDAMNIRHSSPLNRKNEALMATLDTYEANYYNHYPKKHYPKPMGWRQLKM